MLLGTLDVDVAPLVLALSSTGAEKDGLVWRAVEASISSDREVGSLELLSVVVVESSEVAERRG